MRIWDLSPSKLCRKHLLGEHRELHAIWAIITKNKSGYSMHPETIRWKSSLHALFIRHEKLVKEMKRRGYKHNSALDKRLAKGARKQQKFVHSLKEQIEIIRSKKCNCKI